MEEHKIEKKRKPLWKRVVLFSFIFVFAAVFYWIFPLLTPLFNILQIQCSPKRQYDPQACIENMKNLSSALQLYMEANDNYPPAEVWMDELSNYLRTDDLTPGDQQKKLQCPDLARTDPNAYGYAYNAQIAEKWTDEIEDPANTPAIYDSTKTGRNAHDKLPFESLPKTPREGGNNVIWADGHVSPVKKQN